MDNTKSIATVRSSLFDGEWRKPCYDSYCFARIPDTLFSLFGLTPRTLGPLPDDCLPKNRNFRHIALLFIDAFGWEALERYTEGGARPLKAMQKIRERAMSSLITSQFPSTTAAHVSCIHFGKPVFETGVYEWWYYNSRIGKVISPLIYSNLSGNRPGSLMTDGFLPEDVFIPADFYSQLKSDANIDSFIFQLRPYVESPFNRFVLRGANPHPFDNYRVGLQEMARVVLDRPGYSFFYHDSFDHVCHSHGPASKAADEIAEEIFDNIESLFLKPIQGAGDVLVLITADHGQTYMDASTTLFIDELFPEILNSLELDTYGQPKVPVGSARDFFLHTRIDKTANVVPRLKDIVGETAVVYETEKLLHDEVFGPRSMHSNEFLSNLAPVVILPRAGESCYWSEKGKFVKPFIGHHGGLTSAEMESIFLALEP
jgi:predicted AlkP superfamily pyrophosphatase or phosphodiesterase